MKRKRVSKRNSFRVKRSFKKEFKKQVRWAIIAAVGFIIAFAWRNAIYNGSRSIVERFSTTIDLVLTEFYTAIFITIIGVIILLVSSKVLKS